jgi:hypothetical protein
VTRKVFAVVNTRGPTWDHDKPMEEHEGWRAHADFMNALVAEVEARLADDVWVMNDLLRRRSIAPWTLRLGALPDP